MFGSGPWNSNCVNQFVTTNATPVVLQWANLAVVGAGVWFNAIIIGLAADGQRGFFRRQEGHAARSVNGPGVRSMTSVQNGYTNTTGLPWATVGVPVGWAADAASLSGNLLRYTITGVAAMNINWSVNIDFMRGPGTT